MSTHSDNLTRVQRRALDAIRELGHELQRPPTHRELQARLGYKSTQTTFSLLGRLEATGRIRREGRYRYRGIRLTDGTDPEAVRRALEELAALVWYLVAHQAATAPELTAALEDLLATGWHYRRPEKGETP
jgi:SOS-response transcriptional repressor LexA